MTSLPFRARQRGIALPVILIILTVMLVTSIYLLKASHSTTLAVSNLAYDSTQSRAADLGLHAGFDWLRATATANKPALDADDGNNGYRASLDTTLGLRDAAYWTGSKVVTDGAGNQVEYVIHRLCAASGRYDSGNACVQTSSNTATAGNLVALGSSLASDAPNFASTPQVHYVIAARLYGVRGGNVINQLVVLIGA